MGLAVHKLGGMLFLLLCICASRCHGLHKCHPKESQALLFFKARLNDSRGTLISWLNGTDCCTWHGISCDLHTNHVVTVNITYSLDGGVISDSLCDLCSLKGVELQSNQLTGTLPVCLGNLSHLQFLDLSYNYLSGPIPPDICLLTHLTFFFLSNNQFNGSIPSCIGKLYSLQYLFFRYNQLSGSVPESLGNLSSLSFLDVSHNSLSGTLPSSIAKLSSLISLWAHGNAFNETIPPSTLPPSMQILSLSLNKNQTISETFFHNLTNLKVLYISNCILNISTTWIPSFQLRMLGFISCKINDQIPLWISTQYFLEGLDLSDNNLSGEIPSWLWETSSSLEDINLTANHLQGCLFTNSSMPLKLVRLDVSKNLLSGYLPSLWPSNTTFLQLNDNLFTGNIPSSLGTLSHLQVLNLANNQLNGIIPPSLANCSSLEGLDLRNNSLNGYMPYEFGRLYQLKSLVVRNNKLKGLFPPSITNCTNLQLLDIGDNSFQGQIPKSIGNLSLLKVLVMKGNHFTGNIPLEIGQLAELQILHLSSNNLSGSIPQNILSLQAMAIVKEVGFVLSQIITSNLFSGIYKVNFEGLNTGIRSQYPYILSNLISIDLSNTKSEGEVGFALSQLIKSNLSSSIYKLYFEGLNMTAKGINFQYPYILSNLISIDLSNNKLEGEVPSNFGKLKGVILLNLSMNYLNGCIPNSLGKMSQLESLDLSSNRFSGKIPRVLESLDYLGKLDLSNNNLSGSIPQGKKLNIFPESSYIGNLDLWGCPLPKKCSWPQFASPPPRANKKKKSTKIPWYEITLGLACGAGFGITIALIIVKESWRKNYFEKVDVVLKFLFPWLNKWTL